MSKSKHPERVGRSRIAIPSLAEIRNRLVDCASEFDRGVQHLRADPKAAIWFSEIRGFLTEAGTLLRYLLLHGTIEGPSPLPPWLKWNTRNEGRRPYFRGIRSSLLADWSPKRSVRGLIQFLAGHRRVFDKATPRKGNELDRRPFHHRHIFVEAIAGWLGNRCRPRLAPTVPTLAAVIVEPAELHRDHSEVTSDIDLVVDWVEAPVAEQGRMFLDLARAAASACRFLADAIEGASPTVVARSALRAPPGRATEESGRLPRNYPQQAPVKNSDLIALQDFAEQVGIPYSTLTSRRLRMGKGKRPEPVGKDGSNRNLFLVGDLAQLLRSGGELSDDA